MRVTNLVLIVVFVTCGCTQGGGPSVDLDAGDGDETPDAVEDVVEDVPADTAPDTMPSTCSFGYETIFLSSGESPPPEIVFPRPEGTGDGSTAHAEPSPPYFYRLTGYKDVDDLVMPGYTDDMPPFERGLAWTTERRCYETPRGVQMLTEPEAFELYRGVAEATTGIPVITDPEVRTVVGLRGAYPGTFDWHGNTPDRFNDTLVLMWIDIAGLRHVREFHAHTDVGARDFGFESSSSLRPNRRYWFHNGWHNDYNALRNSEPGYMVRDDTNNNGHWDSDRNGWLPPVAEQDYDRIGSYHNIHLASVDGPVGTARVNGWSAGCQTIPGSVNWTEFIVNAWTEMDDPVNYFLVDVRDIPHDYWWPCDGRDGSHECPLTIGSLPFSHDGDTSLSSTDLFDVYSCSSVDESGPEVVYELTIDTSGTLEVSVTCEDPVVDIDVHLLDADDSAACLARDHWALSHPVSPGRYYVVADTYFDGGSDLVGEYTISVTLE